jgi:glutathione S-transferase
MSASIRALMIERPILWSFRRCPYAMRARMALYSAGIEVEIREIVLRDKPMEMLAASPKGTVPVLVLPTGQVIDESLDIMRWALAQSDPRDWLAGDDPPLIAANDGPFKQALDRYKYPHRYGLDDPLPHREAGLEHLHRLNECLQDQAWLVGNQCGITDIALFPFVRQFAATDQTWFDGLPLPRLQHWLATLLESSAFSQIMTRWRTWTEGTPPVVMTSTSVASSLAAAADVP